MKYQDLSLNWLDELKQRADIVSVVSGYVPLTRKGGRYWACCPFHAERTPSFAVDENRGTWYCFGACHEGGNVIDFEMKINDIGFKDAVLKLSQRVGIKLPEDFALGERRNEGQKKRGKEMMSFAQKYYQSSLLKSQVAKQYLLNRGIDLKTAEVFGLGYSPDYYGLANFLGKNKFSKKEMLDVGLLAEKDGNFYDFFAKRLIVPIYDQTGDVIAFGGRVLEKRDGVAKYKNSRENFLFVKNRVLYGLNFVKKAKIGNPISDIVLVEGYMDVIGLYQKGIKNVVASMGTSLTDNQAKLLKSMIDTVYICYDGDFAGQSSTLRGLQILKNHGLRVMVMTLPDGVDPDELVRESVEPFIKCKNDALPLYDYLIKRAEDGLDLNTAEGKALYAKKALQVIEPLDEIERDIYIKVISSKSGVSGSKLAKSIKKSVTSPTADNKNKESEQSDSYYEACRYMLAYLLIKPSADKLFERELLYDETHILIYDYLLECVSNGRNPQTSTLYSIDGDKRELLKIIETKVPEKNSELAFGDCLKTVTIKYLTDKKSELLNAYSLEQDAEVKAKYVKQISELTKRITDLRNTSVKV